MIVKDVGPQNADIMIVGEAPGGTEDTYGEPFIGASGKLLKNLLRHIGIDYSQCYVTNVSPKRPPGNDFKYLYDKREPIRELREYIEKLNEKIEIIKPNVVITLGNEALKAITGRSGISNWRGSILHTKNTKVIPTYHPSAVLRQYTLHPIMEKDLERALKNSTFPEVRFKKADIKIRPSFEQAKSWLKESNSYRYLTYDIETIGSHIRCIGFARGNNGKESSMVIPFIQMDKTLPVDVGKNNLIQLSNRMNYNSSPSYWNERQEIEILDLINQLFENTNVRKIGHNSISFDAPMIYDEFGIKIRNHYMDTMHAFHLKYSEFNKGLKFLCSLMTDYPNYWTDKVTEDDNSEWTYCAYDCLVTLDVAMQIKEEIDFNLYTHIHNLAYALSRVEKRGVLIDVEERDKIIKEQNEKLKEIKDKLSNAYGTAFNSNSPQQIKALIKQLGYRPPIKNQKETTDEVSLKKLAREHPEEPIFNDIITYRKISKLINTFLEVELDDDNRIRTSYNASGTKSGRISSSKNIFGKGMNLQNIPVGKSKGITSIRKIFISSPGKLFIKADLSQAEALVVADILARHGDYTLKNLYKNPEFDIHTWTASHIFNVDESKVTKYQRSVGKLANHSGNYGAGPGVLTSVALKQDIPGISYNDAKKILYKRHKAIPGLKKWWSDIEQQVMATRKLTNCLGRERFFFGRFDATTFRDAYSWEPQSTVGDLTNRILTKLELSPRCKGDIILQVHDEICLEVTPEYLRETCDLIKEFSHIPLYIIPDNPLYIPMDIEVGKNWKDVVDEKDFH